MSQARLSALLLLLFISTSSFGQTPNPVPTLTSVNPAIVIPGFGFPMTVIGSGFNVNSVVRFDNNPLPTTFVSSTQLQATVSATLVPSPTTSSVTVFNPAPGGGVTTVVPVYVEATGANLPLPVTRYIPHIVNGGGYLTKIRITDLSSSGVTNPIVILFFRGCAYSPSDPNCANGQLLNSGGDSYVIANGGTITIPPSAGQFGSPADFRWALINAGQTTFTASIVFEFANGQGTIVNTIGFNESKSDFSFTVPVEFQPNSDSTQPGLARTVGMALANTTGTATTVNVTLLDASGNVVVATGYSLPPMGQIHTDIGNDLANFLPKADFVGALTLTATQAFVAAALQDDTGPFYAIPTVVGKAH